MARAVDEPVSADIYIVVRDRALRLQLGAWIAEAGFEARPFLEPEDFIDEIPHLKPGCLLLDAEAAAAGPAPVMAELRRRDRRWPSILLLAEADVPAAVAAMRLGAFDVIEAPLRKAELVDTLRKAMGGLGEERERQLFKAAAARKAALLTEREREVVRGLLKGMSNSDLAAALGLSIRTIEFHRGRALRKLGTRNRADLAGIAAAAGLV